MKRAYFQKLSQRQRLLVLLLIFSGAPILIIGLVSYFVTTDAINNIAVETSQEMIHRVSNDLDNLFIDSLNIGRMMAEDIDIQTILRNQYRSISEKYSYDLKGDTRLSFLPAYKQEIYGLYVIGQNGNEHKSRSASFREGDLRKTHWYKKVLNANGPVWFGPHAGSFAVVSVDDQLVSCGIQVKDKAKGYKSGIVLIDLEKELLNKMLRSHLGKNGQMFISDNRGNIIADAYHVKKSRAEIVDISRLSYQSDPEDAINIENLDDNIIFAKKLHINNWLLIGTIPKSELIQKASFLRITIILCCVMVIVLAIFFSISVSGIFVRPINKLKGLMKRVEEGDFNVQFKTEREDEIGQLSNGFNKMVNNIKELRDKIIEDQNKLRKAEFSALQAQINPHFLYNTLDSIVWFARKGAYREIIDMVIALTSFFRIGLSRGMDIITLRNEIEHVRNYLIIQSMRYQDKFDYEIHMQESCYNALTLKLLLQPIVENAIYHGIKQKSGKGKIIIRCAPIDQCILIEVKDTGIGMSSEQLELLTAAIHGDHVKPKGKGYGLKNVNERIKIYFGKEYGLKITSVKEEGTIVRITIPKRVEGDNVAENYAGG